TILPLVLAHRIHDRAASRIPLKSSAEPFSPAGGRDRQTDANEALERVFRAKEIKTFAIRTEVGDIDRRGTSAEAKTGERGPVIRVVRTESPSELDLRSTLNHSLLRKGKMEPQ